MGIRHVHVNTTSLNGCNVEVDGDVVYTLIPLRVTGFHGVVHITGESGCPNGDLYFGIEPKGRVAPTLPANECKP